MDGYNRAKTILTDNRDGLVRIAEALLERESLDAAEIQQLLAGQTLAELGSLKSELERKNQLLHSKEMVRPLTTTVLSAGKTCSSIEP